ncbi:MAG: sel1 repeat family protein [Flavobacteriaceae bacterium]|nr:sel1 repeat family protein [Flavobacteriaceae bacterium]
MRAVYGFYADGLGVAQNAEQMLVWGTKIGLLTCEAKNPIIATEITNIRIDLAQKYRNGYRLEKDLLKSYQWFLLYNENKNFEQDFMQEAYIEQIQALEKELGPKQKEQAKRNAETLLGSPLRNVQNLHIVEP